MAQDLKVSNCFAVVLMALSFCSVSKSAFAEERRVFLREGFIAPHIDVEDAQLQSLAVSLLKIFSTVSGVDVKSDGDLNFYLVERIGIISRDEFRSKYLTEEFGEDFSASYFDGVRSENPCYTKFFIEDDMFVSSFSLIDQSIDGFSHELCVAKSIALAFGFYTNEPDLNIGEFLSLSIPHVAAIGSCRDSEDIPKCASEKIERDFKSGEIETKFFGVKK